MIYRKIASSLRIDAGNNFNPEVALTPSSGGRMIKTAGYMIRILSVSDSGAQIGLKLYHGPNGISKILHSTPITLAAPGGDLMAGDSSAGSMMLFEWLHPTLVGGSVNGKWVLVDVYEILKPF